MVDNIRTYFRLLKLYGQLDFLLATRELKLVIIQFFANISTAIASTIGVWVIYSNLNLETNEPTMLLLMAYPILLNGLYAFFFSSGNWGRISRVISRGQLDNSFIQPVPLPAQFFTQGFAPFTAGLDFIFSIVLFVVACFCNNLFTTFSSTISIFCCVLCSYIVLVASMFFCSVLAFYAPIAGEEISDTIYELFSNTKAYPLESTPYAFRSFFCFIIPIGLLVWFPETILLSTNLNFRLLYLICFTIVYSLIAIIIFKKGLRHYEKTGSTRFTSFGYK